MNRFIFILAFGLRSLSADAQITETQARHALAGIYQINIDHFKQMHGLVSRFAVNHWNNHVIVDQTMFADGEMELHVANTSDPHGHPIATIGLTGGSTDQVSHLSIRVGLRETTPGGLELVLLDATEIIQDHRNQTKHALRRKVTLSKPFGFSRNVQDFHVPLQFAALRNLSKEN